MSPTSEDMLGISSHLGPSQPVIANAEILCWGTFQNLFAFFCKHSTSNRASTRRSERDKASKQTELALANM